MKVLKIYFLILLLAIGCSENVETQKLKGKTMGTSYQIQIRGQHLDNLKAEADKLLIELNHSVSTYEKESLISRFNKSDSGMKVDEDFEIIYLAAQTVWEQSNGFFDPTVMPLVNAWGFGPAKSNRELLKQEVVDSLLAFVGMQYTSMNDECFISKENSHTQLDFSAIAKGYGVDLLAEYLDSKGADDYLVEIGGEVRCKGSNWTVGIDKPLIGEKAGSVSHMLNGSNFSLASSGNYRIFYESDGVLFGHEIDPKTGFPKQGTLLGVSVIAPNCMLADAWATAFMVMDIVEAKKTLERLEGIDVLFIYAENKELQSYASGKFNDLIAEKKD